MNGTKFIAELKRKLRVSSDVALGSKLGVTNATLSNWRNNRALSPRQMAAQIGRLLGEQASGEEVVKQLRKQLNAKSLVDLKRKLGVTVNALHDWKNSRTLTARRIAGLVKKASRAATTSSYATAVRPLVEFFKIAKCTSKQGAKHELFSIASTKGTHSYLAGLQLELKDHHGVYVFFDSRGQAIYAGKARKQSLWHEITHAFNRDRGSVQKIKRVRHPERNQAYRTSDEKVRQIRDVEVPLHELATYFSAYEVSDPLIEDIESLLVRSFANNLLNIRMEQFGRHRLAKKLKRRRKKSPRHKTKRKKRP